MICRTLGLGLGLKIGLGLSLGLGICLGLSLGLEIHKMKMILRANCNSYISKKLSSISGYRFCFSMLWQNSIYRSIETRYDYSYFGSHFFGYHSRYLNFGIAKNWSEDV